MEATPLSAFKITGTRIDGFVGEGITEVVIPDGITEIEAHAFYHREYPASKHITSIIIPDSVIKIGHDAFVGANKLERVRLPKHLQVLESFIFWECINLRTIHLPTNLQIIRRGAFCRSGITSIIIPSGVTTIEHHVFSRCLSLKQIILPESVTTLYDEAFDDSRQVVLYTTAGSCAEKFAQEHGNSINIITKTAMDELLIAEKNAFPEYPKELLKSIAAPIPPVHTPKIGSTPLSAFKITGTRIDGFVGEGISDVVIPEGITEIGMSAFLGSIYPASRKITSIVIPDSVEKIGKHAFSGAEKLEYIRLPANLQILEDGVFRNCNSLRRIDFPSGLRTIERNALSITSVSRVIIPSSVTEIGHAAFGACMSLLEITLPDSVINIAAEAFHYNKRFTFRTTAGSYAEKYAKEHGIPVKIITKAAMAAELASANKNYPDYPNEAKKPTEKQDQIDVIRNDDDFAKVRDKARALLDEAKRSGDASSKKFDEINSLLKKMEEYASATAVASPITPNPEHSTVKKTSNPAFAEKLRTDTKTPSQLREEARQKEQNRAAQVSAELENRIAKEAEYITNKIRSECESMAAQGKRKLKTSVNLSNNQWPSNTTDKEKRSAYQRIRSAVEQQLKNDRFPVLHVDLKKTSSSTRQSTHELRFFIVW